MTDSDSPTSSDPPTGRNVRPVGKPGKWVPSHGGLTKLTKDISGYMTAAKVRTRFQAAHGGRVKLPDSLKDSRISSISNETRGGLSEQTFGETVRALAPLYPEFFSGRRYRDVADNPDSLKETGDDFIDPGIKHAVGQPINAPGGQVVLWKLLQVSVAIGIGIGIATMMIASFPKDGGDSPKDPLSVSQYLARLDPQLFYGSKDGLYDVARLNVNKEAEYSETDFAGEIAGTWATFDIMANNAGFVKEIMFPIMEEGLQRGVRYRIVLSDYRTSNQWNELFSEMAGYKQTGATAVPAQDTHQTVAEFLQRIETDKLSNPRSKYTGSLEIRWNPRFLFNTMWIRDAGQDDAIAHLGIHTYRGKGTWPSLRVSRKTAPDMVDSIAQEFRFAFDNGIEFGELPLPK